MNAVRIATLNLWNSDRWRTERWQAAITAVTALAPDVIALQEVAMPVSREAIGALGGEAAFAHVAQHRYPGETEGLAVLSRHPIRVVEADSEIVTGCAMRVEVEIPEGRIGVTNVHLDGEHVLARERQIVEVVDWIARTTGQGQHEVLVGDFNSTPGSSVGRFLAGQQSLDGRDSPPWHDLAALHAHRLGTVPEPTLDMDRNPRWQVDPALECPMRIDWVLLRDPFTVGLPSPRLVRAGIFGDVPDREGVVPSDHWGVFADLEFERDRR